MSISDTTATGKEAGKGKNRIFQHPLVVAACIAVAGVILWKAIPKNPGHTTVEWKFGNQTLKLNVHNDMSDPGTLIQKLMSKKYSRAGTLALLGADGIYSIQDPAMVPALQKLCPDRGPAGETLLQRAQRLHGCLNIAVVKDVRELATQHQGPFQYIGQEVEIGTPPKIYQPGNGQANVCEDRGLLGHKMEIDTLQGLRSISVVATGQYPCTDYSKGVVPDIQLSAHDALHLFGRPTRKLEKAVAVPL